LQPGQKHASSVICELSSQLRACEEVVGWLHPHPRKRGDILSRLDLVSPAFRADASIGKVKSTTTSLPAMLWPIYGREKIRRDACNEPAAELFRGLVQKRTGRASAVLVLP